LRAGGVRRGRHVRARPVRADADGAARHRGRLGRRHADAVVAEPVPVAHAYGARGGPRSPRTAGPDRHARRRRRRPLKMQVFPEDSAVAALARMLRRPVKWIEEGRENLAAASQAREGRTTVDIAAAADGTLLAIRARIASDAGAYHAYPTTAALEPLGTASILPGPYRVPAYEYDTRALATHKPPLGAYP